jgi:predicted RND superfamily exporter protein
MVAFVSLVVSDIKPVIDFGWMMTLGIAVAFIVCFTLLPSLVLLWPKGRPVRHSGADAPLTLHFARFADRHGRSVLWTSAGLILVVVAGVSQLRVENRFIDYFKESTEIYRGMELLDSRLGGTIPLDIVLSAPDASAPLPGLEPVADGGGEPVAADDPFAADAPGFDSAPQERDAAEDLAGDDPFAQDDPFAAEDPFAGDGDPFAGGGETFEPSYWFSLEGMRTIDAAHELVASREETGKVLSLATTFSVVRDLLGEDIGSVELALVQRSFPEEVARQLVDPYFDADREEARITVRVKETSKTLRRDQLLRELSTELAGLDALSADDVRLTGMLVLYNNVLQSLFRSQILTLGAVFLAILVMFWVLFRSFSLAMVALAPNLLAATLVLGIMGLVGIPLDIMTITIAAIVVGIGVDDCVHYVYRFREEFREDRDYLAAMYRSHGSIGRAMYYTTITIVIGFSMLTLSNFTPSIYFGLLTVLAMTAAVLGALLLLPRLIILFRPLGPEGQ